MVHGTAWYTCWKFVLKWSVSWDAPFTINRVQNDPFCVSLKFDFSVVLDIFAREIGLVNVALMLGVGKR